MRSVKKNLTSEGTRLQLSAVKWQMKGVIQLEKYCLLRQGYRKPYPPRAAPRRSGCVTVLLNPSVVVPSSFIWQDFQALYYSHQASL